MILVKKKVKGQGQCDQKKIENFRIIQFPDRNSKSLNPNGMKLRYIVGYQVRKTSIDFAEKRSKVNVTIIKKK